MKYTGSKLRKTWVETLPFTERAGANYFTTLRLTFFIWKVEDIIVPSLQGWGIIKIMNINLLAQCLVTAQAPEMLTSIVINSRPEDRLDVGS